ncbi:alpha/beta hydrolase [Streptomyces nigrescens]|uniref:alpha/beta fold hydrolase n=1 Tax=Streptomyces nigrescens TaxID=1920 RepID=UPI00348B731D
MPAFAAPDGTALAYHVVGEGEPLLCLPGGPMRASGYLGDLGGLSERRRLIKLDLREAAGIYASSGAFAPDAARAALEGMDARVLLLAGEVDSGPLPRIAADIAKLLPRAELAVQPGAGHYPWLDDPRRFTRTVAAFLGQEPAGPVG